MPKTTPRLNRVRKATAEETSVYKVKAIELLATGMTDSEVARQIGTSQPRVWHWRTHDPAFIAALRKVRTEGLERAKSLLDCNATSAVEVVREILADQGMQPQFRLKAAEMMLDRVGLHAKSRTDEVRPTDSPQDIRDALREIARQHPELIAEVVGETMKGGK